jgi:CHRD domain
MRLRVFITCVCAGLVCALALAIGAFAGDGGRPFATTLTGAAEIPGPGDPDGSGTAQIRLNPGQEQICFELSVSNITLPATGAHIHVGTATESGPVVVGLTPPDTSGTSSGCVSADRDLIIAIIQNPENYYVNVHTVPLYAAGAVRGQLGS